MLRLLQTLRIQQKNNTAIRVNPYKQTSEKWGQIKTRKNNKNAQNDQTILECPRTARSQTGAPLRYQVSKIPAQSSPIPATTRNTRQAPTVCAKTLQNSPI